MTKTLADIYVLDFLGELRTVNLSRLKHNCAQEESGIGGRSEQDCFMNRIQWSAPQSCLHCSKGFLFLASTAVFALASTPKTFSIGANRLYEFETVVSWNPVVGYPRPWTTIASGCFAELSVGLCPLAIRRPSPENQMQ